MLSTLDRNFLRLNFKIFFLLYPLQIVFVVRWGGGGILFSCSLSVYLSTHYILVFEWGYLISPAYRPFLFLPENRF